MAKQRQLSHPVSDKLPAAKSQRLPGGNPLCTPGRAEPLASLMPRTAGRDTRPRDTSSQGALGAALLVGTVQLN